MKDSSISKLLSILVAIPLLALVVALALQVRHNFADYKDSQRTQRVMAAAVSAGDLIHVLQIERGTTAGFLQSKGQKFADVLPGVRGKTDERVTAYKRELDALDVGDMAALGRAVTAAKTQLDGLASLRSRAGGLVLPVAEGVGYYTTTIGALMAAIGTSVEFSKESAITQKTIAYHNLIHAKENAGLERALATAGFAANKVDPAQYRGILDKISRQEAYLAAFRGIADDAERAALDAVLGGAPAKEVERLRAVMAEKSAEGGFDVDATAWFKTITGKIDGMREVESQLARNIVAGATTFLNASRSMFIAYLLLGALAVALTVGISLWMAKGIAVPLHGVVRSAESSIAANDFTGRMPEAGAIEVQRTGEAFNHLMDKFRGIIVDTKSSSERITQAADALAASSQQVTASSAVQSGATASVAAAVEQASVNVSETAASARAAAEVVNRAREDNEQALAVMRETVGNMNSIASLIRESGSSVERLDESSQKIGGIVQVIKEIADQTNLLALNAAIEAARAGEQGRGFAVVADEVRKLAERTAKATDEIAKLISGIQAGINVTVSGMQQANEQAGASLELVGRTESALLRVGEGSREVESNVLSISSALNAQDASMHHIAESVETIARMTEENSATAATNSRTATELDGLAHQLREAVAVFRV
ncbi:MAG: methyl-accepting chemotaxis protein [Sulfuritalea sp.]|nr:methyl-accepting chemotaxis protein [Sulfuritalea sp.]